MTEISDELELELRGRLTVLETTVHNHDGAIAMLALSIMLLAGALLFWRARTPA